MEQKAALMQYINCTELLFLINSARLCRDKYKIALDRKLILSPKLLPKWIACCGVGFSWKTLGDLEIILTSSVFSFIFEICFYN